MLWVLAHDPCLIHPSTRKWEFSLTERLDGMIHNLPRRISDIELITVIEAAGVIRDMRKRLFPHTPDLGPAHEPRVGRIW